MSKTFSRAAAPAFVSLMAIPTLFAVGNAVSAATLTYTAQTRTLDAEAYGVPSQSASAPDYAPFDTTVISGSGNNIVRATQQSQLLPSQVTYRSEFTGTRSTLTPGLSQNIHGRSVLNVTFTLDASSPYDFNFKELVPTGFGGYCLASLTDLSNNTQPFYLQLPNYPWTTASGTLAAGSYRFSMIHDQTTGLMSNSLTSGFQATLTVPEPASMALLAGGFGLLGRRRLAGRR